MSQEQMPTPPIRFTNSVPESQTRATWIEAPDEPGGHSTKNKGDENKLLQTNQESFRCLKMYSPHSPLFFDDHPFTRQDWVGIQTTHSQTNYISLLRIQKYRIRPPHMPRQILNTSTCHRRPLHRDEQWVPSSV